MFMKILDNLLSQRTENKSPRLPHLYHYTRQNADEKARIHLRMDVDGHGTLIVNANRILHLNPSAAFMAWLILEEKTKEGSLRAITKRYNVSRRQAEEDLSAFNVQLLEIIRPDGACPLHELDLETSMPFSARPSAPYRMDLAVTYRCNNACTHCYNARPRNYPELDTAHWKMILDKLLVLGVPHIVFTGGEATLRDDLPELIAHAESNGQITGLNTNARRLSDGNYLQELVDAGLDHVQITVESCDDEIHDRMMRVRGAYRQTIRGLENALASPLYVMTNTTMLHTNIHKIPDTLDFLAQLGVPTIGLNALIYAGNGLTVGTGLKESELQPLLDLAVKKTSEHDQRLIWYTPTQYCQFDPIQQNLGVKGCSAALYSMCIESNGDVLPCQSYYQPLGNLLTSEWDEIWNHDLSVQLRERRNLPAKCNSCTLVPECGGGCPLQFQSEKMQVLV
jgi:radical SAM protein with 4Fe4S-binding SPASM domain